MSLTGVQCRLPQWRRDHIQMYRMLGWALPQKPKPMPQRDDGLLFLGPRTHLEYLMQNQRIKERNVFGSNPLSAIGKPDWLIRTLEQEFYTVTAQEHIVDEDRPLAPVALVALMLAGLILEKVDGFENIWLTCQERVSDRLGRVSLKRHNGQIHIHGEQAVPDDWYVYAEQILV